MSHSRSLPSNLSRRETDSLCSRQCPIQQLCLRIYRYVRQILSVTDNAPLNNSAFESIATWDRFRPFLAVPHSTTPPSSRVECRRLQQALLWRGIHTVDIATGSTLSPEMREPRRLTCKHGLSKQYTAPKRHLSHQRWIIGRERNLFLPSQLQKHTKKLGNAVYVNLLLVEVNYDFSGGEPRLHFKKTYTPFRGYISLLTGKAYGALFYTSTWNAILFTYWFERPKVISSISTQ